MIDRRGNEILYMAVRDDEYELPFAVFETLQDVADWAGTTAGRVSSKICKDRLKKPNRRFRKRNGINYVRVIMDAEYD